MSVIQPTINRTPPQNIEAEQAVLGTTLIDGDKAAPMVVSKISADDFYRESHRVLFSAIADLFSDNCGVDMLTVVNRLQQKGELESVGGAAYVASLAGSPPSLSRINRYCDIVKEKATLRRMINLATEVQEECYEGATPNDVTNLFGKTFFELASGESDNISTIGELLPRVIEQIEYRSKNSGGLLGLSTGFDDIDRVIAGLPPTDLIVIAARPAMGKTAFAIGIAESVAKQGGRSLIFSLEMGREQLATRSLASKARLSLSAIRKGNIMDHQFPRLANAASEIKGLPMIIDDTPGLSVMQLRARAKMIHARKPIDAIFVDYLQLLSGTGQNRTQEIGDISRNLKCLAKELNVPVIALSQLNRSVESRTDKRPMMSDLRESGAIEQDADTIMFIYRDDVYNTNDDNPLKGIAEIIISKQRNGPTGKVKLCFLKEFTRFESLATRD